MMQGYVDMIKKPVWNAQKMELSGVSSVVAGEPYAIIVTLNGYSTESAFAEHAECNVEALDSGDQLARISILSDKTENISWGLKFLK